MTRACAGAALAAAVLLAASPAAAWFEQRLAGSRAFSMGGAAAANVTDVSALFWNPAGLGAMTQRQFLLDYAQPYMTREVSENSGAYGTRWRETGLAVGWHWLGVTGAYSELVASVSAGRVLRRTDAGHVVSGGGTLQYLRAGFDAFTVAGTGEAVDYGSRSTVNADLGVRWETPWHMDFAWVGRNVTSPTIRFVDGSPGGRLELRNELGAAFRWNRESTVTAGLVLEPGASTSFALGAEIWFYEVFAIRSGFTELSKVLSAGDSPTEFQYAGGFGVRHRGWEVAASAFTNHDLGVSYRASLLKTFSGGSPQ
jgi:hypothetical protein